MELWDFLSPNQWLLCPKLQGGFSDFKKLLNTNSNANAHFVPNVSTNRFQAISSSLYLSFLQGFDERT